MNRMGLFILLVATFTLSSVHAQTDSSKGSSKANARQYVTLSAERHYAAIMQRNTFRDQVKVLAITIFFVILGIALNKDTKDLKGTALLLAIITVVFLYGIDTSLLDLTQRQELLFREMNANLVRWDKLSEAEVDSALAVTQRKVDDSSISRKLSLAFLDVRVNDQLWYLLPVLIGVGIWYRQKQKELAMSPVKKEKADIIIIDNKPYKIAAKASPSQLKTLTKMLLDETGKYDASAGFELILFIKGKAYILTPA